MARTLKSIRQASAKEQALRYRIRVLQAVGDCMEFQTAIGVSERDADVMIIRIARAAQEHGVLPDDIRVTWALI